MSVIKCVGCGAASASAQSDVCCCAKCEALARDKRAQCSHLMRARRGLVGRYAAGERRDERRAPRHKSECSGCALLNGSLPFGKDDPLYVRCSRCAMRAECDAETLSAWDERAPLVVRERDDAACEHSYRVPVTLIDATVDAMHESDVDTTLTFDADGSAILTLPHSGPCGDPSASYVIATDGDASALAVHGVNIERGDRQALRWRDRTGSPRVNVTCACGVQYRTGEPHGCTFTSAWGRMMLPGTVAAVPWHKHGEGTHIAALATESRSKSVLHANNARQAKDSRRRRARAQGARMASQGASDRMAALVAGLVRVNASVTMAGEVDLT